MSPNPQTILGIDPGIGVTGFCVLLETPSGDLSYLCSGNIRSNAKSPFSVRLKKIFEEVSAVIDLNRPSAVALEDTFVSKNAKAALKLGQARGAAALAAALKDLPVFEYAPTAVKMAVVGHGGASKEQVQRMVVHFLKLPKALGSDHEADAAAVAICHAHSERFQQKISRASKGVLIR